MKPDSNDQFRIISHLPVNICLLSSQKEKESQKIFFRVLIISEKIAFAVPQRWLVKNFHPRIWSIIP